MNECTNDEEARMLREAENAMTPAERLARLEALYGTDEGGAFHCALCMRDDGDMVRMTCDACPLQLYCVQCASELRRLHNHRVCVTCSARIETEAAVRIDVGELARSVWRDTGDARIILAGALIVCAMCGAFILFLMYGAEPLMPAIVWYADVGTALDELLPRPYFLETRNISYVDSAGYTITGSMLVHGRMVEAIYWGVQLVFLLGVFFFYRAVFRAFLVSAREELLMETPRQRFRVLVFSFAPLLFYAIPWLLGPFVIYGFAYAVFKPYLYSHVPHSLDFLSYENLYYVALDAYLVAHTCYLHQRRVAKMGRAVLYAVPTLYRAARYRIAHYLQQHSLPVFHLYPTNLT